MGIAVNGNEIIGIDGIYLASNTLKPHDLLLTVLVGISLHAVESSGIGLSASHIAVLGARHHHLGARLSQFAAQFERFPQVGLCLKKAQGVHYLMIDGSQWAVVGCPAAMTCIHIYHLALEALIGCRYAKSQEKTHNNYS